MTCKGARVGTALVAAWAIAGAVPAGAQEATFALTLDTSLVIVDDPARQAARLERAGAVGRAVADPGGRVRLGTAELQFEGGDESQRRARLVPDPERPEARVLEFAVTAANVAIDRSDDSRGRPLGERRGARDRPGRKARVQMNLYANEGAAEVYQSVRMRLDDGFDALAAASDTFDWLTLSEWWNNAGWTAEPYPFRITVDLVNRGERGQPGLYLWARATLKPPGDARWSRQVWTARAGDWSLPTRQWLTVETWFREGDSRTGRFVVAVTAPGSQRRILVDVHDFTHHPDQRAPDGLRHLNPLKLYTSQALIEAVRRSAPRLAVQWADLEIRACAASQAAPSSCERAMAMR